MSSTLRNNVVSGASAHVPLGLAGVRLERIERIAVLNDGGVVDVIATLPAIEALAAAYPGADLTLLVSGRSRLLLDGRPGPWHDVVDIPESGEKRLEDTSRRARRRAELVKDLGRRRFDLAVQLHGDPRRGDGLVPLLGARVSAGPAHPGVEEFDRGVPGAPLQNGVVRALEIVAAVGAAPVVLEPRLAVTGDDRQHLSGLLRSLAFRDGAPLVVLHPGGRPALRWPAGWFGDIAARAAAAGWRVVLVGDESEKRLARDLVREAVGRGADARALLDLTGRTDPTDVIGLVDLADVVVGNDSAPVHLARAVGTPTVTVAWIGSAVETAPLGRVRDRVHLGWTTHCPVCGADGIRARVEGTSCGHDASFVAGVPAAPVWADVVELVLAGRPRPSAPAPDDLDAY